MTTGDPLPFGELLRRLRTAATLTQEELCERTGLSVRGLSDLERGMHHAPRPETLRLIADALQLEPTERAGLIAAAHPEQATARSASAPVFSPLPTLPGIATRFIGREAEIAALHRLLTELDVRLVTLTGPGGVGKTRLALRVAADLAADFAHGVAWVPLGTIREPDLVASTVAHALGVRESSGRSPLEGVAAALRDRRLLLVIDNFEQVVEAAPFVAQLLAACIGLKVLVTSRAVLRVSGEHEVSVPPLALPDPAAQNSRLAEAEAVRLFVERAREIDAAFALTPDNAESAAAICRRLDGLPLAIELAAAWLRLLPLDALLARLERRLPLLTGGPRDAPAHQQTLQATIAWSYDLLQPGDRRLFRRMSVFVGGFTLEAAEYVGGEEGGAALGGRPLRGLGGDGTTNDEDLPSAPAPSPLSPLSAAPPHPPLGAATRLTELSRCSTKVCSIGRLQPLANLSPWNHASPCWRRSVNSGWPNSRPAEKQQPRGGVTRRGTPSWRSKRNRHCLVAMISSVGWLFSRPSTTICARRWRGW